MKTIIASALALLLVSAMPFNAGAPSLPAHYRATNNMPYVTGGVSRQWMDLFYVRSNATPTPVVLWVHGGGWRYDDENFPRALALTNHNIAVAAISYRYTTHLPPSVYPANLPHPAQIQDVKSAMGARDKSGR